MKKIILLLTIGAPIFLQAQVEWPKREIGLGFLTLGIQNIGNYKFMESPFFKANGNTFSNGEFIRQNGLPSLHMTNWVGENTALRIDLYTRSFSYRANIININGATLSNVKVNNMNLELSPMFIFGIKQIANSRIYMGAGPGIFTYRASLQDTINNIVVNNNTNGFLYQGLLGYTAKLKGKFGMSIEAKYMARDGKDAGGNKLSSKIIYPIGRLSLNYIW